MSDLKQVMLAAGLLLAGLAPPAQATIIGGVEFPQGAISFADQVVSYNPAFGGGNTPSANHQGAFNALGVPNYAGVNGCASQAACSFVSLGDGGRLVVRFTDNVLTGSNSSAFDLWIFEVGPDVEATFVDVSADGIAWSSVGAVGGSTRGINIDAFGFNTSSVLRFVRLTDNGQLGGQSGATVGADIDAVGAISTRAVVPGIPEPATWLTMLAGFGLTGTVLRRRPRQMAAA
ncbi:PEPxxWA-CTERM sorting domain-containing protein [Sandarakinorhabdus sp.]|uniref:PEPxxWA-CTERM sorting domain-containing protein n=1 Tax=Sandarakinorhabdus sp. TaxID=1916663 RepID=UPI00286EA528|nr:PEPxxWA-CTERM sorting domain-containing protein [Sandarakinorhabdus sp.]